MNLEYIKVGFEVTCYVMAGAGSLLAGSYIAGWIGAKAEKKIRDAADLRHLAAASRIMRNKMPPPKMPIPTISQSHVSGCRQLKNKPGVYWNPTTQKFYKLANVQSHPATPGVASMNHPDVPKIDPVAEARKKVEETHLDPSFYPGEDDQKI